MSIADIKILCYTINMSDLKTYYKELSSIKQLSIEDEKYTIDLYYLTKAIELRNKLISNYLWLVPQLIGRYNNQGLNNCELIQVGNEALIKAIEHYDKDKGILRHYAIKVINHAIEHVLRIEAINRDRTGLELEKAYSNRKKGGRFLSDFKRL